MMDLKDKYGIFTGKTEKNNNIKGLYVGLSFDVFTGALQKSFLLLSCNFVTLDE
jgi:hypothetical protein